jgi:hypothetical protein
LFWLAEARPSAFLFASFVLITGLASFVSGLHSR